MRRKSVGRFDNNEARALRIVSWCAALRTTPVREMAPLCEAKADIYDGQPFQR
jgi:hypothetical protein